MSDEELVWVCSRTRKGCVPRIHTDPDCPFLDSAESVLEKPRSVLDDDRPTCKQCTGEREAFAAEESTQATRELLLGMDPDAVGGGA